MSFVLKCFEGTEKCRTNRVVLTRLYRRNRVPVLVRAGVGDWYPAPPAEAECSWYLTCVRGPAGGCCCHLSPGRWQVDELDTASDPIGALSVPDSVPELAIEKSFSAVVFAYSNIGY